jgi:5'-3' exonuclease
MGVPSYFSWLVKNHPTIIKQYNKNNKKIVVDNLYLDCNSIVYDAYNRIKFETLTDSIVTTIIKQTILKIKEYINIIQPQKQVIIAFDGVAPVAKLEQQRGRRYKSWYIDNMRKKIYNDNKPSPWSTTAITPGTSFMKELNEKLLEASRDHSLLTPAYINNCNILFSGSDIAGEGEHKIFAYIRDNPTKHNNETTVIYGLDADLIMLSINHLPICPQIYLFRETPEFIKSIDSNLEPNENYMLDIPNLTDAVMKHITSNDVPTDPIIKQNKIYDYIFLCFFLGNDFLPHFPAINIRTGGIDKMMNAYKATIKSNEFLTDGNKIIWANVRKLVSFLADLEEDFIITESRLRFRRENKNPIIETPDDKWKAFDSLPSNERDVEQFINPYKPGWQNRYYSSLFGMKSKDNSERIKQVSINYLEGLEWTMKYYTNGCPDWRWTYNYNYPPLLFDLIKHIPVFETSFIKPDAVMKPVSQLVQLCYVLPRNSLDLLPHAFYTKLLEDKPHWYKLDYNFVWAYCKYFWESHVEMEHIDIGELEEYINNNLFTLKK